MCVFATDMKLTRLKQMLLKWKIIMFSMSFKAIIFPVTVRLR